MSGPKEAFQNLIRKLRDKETSYRLHDKSRSQQPALEVSQSFTLEELGVVITDLSIGKIAGIISIFPELIKHAGLKVKMCIPRS